MILAKMHRFYSETFGQNGYTAGDLIVQCDVCSKQKKPNGTDRNGTFLTDIYWPKGWQAHVTPSGNEKHFCGDCIPDALREASK